MKYCEKCGEQLLDEAVMCPKCKNAIKKEEPKKQNYAAVACGILVALAIIALAIFAVSAQLA